MRLPLEEILRERRTGGGALYANCIAAVLSLAVYVLLEFLFLWTSNSFLNRVAPLEAAELYLVILFPVLAVVSALTLIGAIGRPRLFTLAAQALYIGALFAAGSAIVLYIDTTIYTLMRVRPLALGGVWKIATYLLLIGVFVAVRASMRAVLRDLQASRAVFRLLGGATVTVLALSAGAFLRYAPATCCSTDARPVRALKNTPNIVILVSDGVDANRTSIYGYGRQTTPFLYGMKDKLAVFENAFPNSTASLSSFLSTMTGKLPLKTKTVYYPDILRNVDSFQHLPGILKRHGYSTEEIGVRLVSDAVDNNMREGFDLSNGRAWSDYRIADRFLGCSLANYLFVRLQEKLQSIILDILLIKRSPDFHRALTGSELLLSTQDFKLERLRGVLGGTRPFLVYAHFMVTHGPYFYPRTMKFSRGKRGAGLFDEDRYDDAISTFDGIVRLVFEELDSQHILDNTIVVVTSDHGKDHSFAKVPLLIYFPDQRKIDTASNVQLLDLAPTMLDYAGIGIPAWMDGKSLLRSSAAQRPIFFIDRVNEFGRDPPYYNVQSFGVVIGDCEYVLDLPGLEIRETGLSSEVSACLPGPALDPKKMILDRLQKYGYCKAE